MNCQIQSEKMSQISTKSKSIFSSPELLNVSTGQRTFRTLAPTTTSPFILDSIQSSTQESRFQAPFKQGTPQFDRRLGPIEESIPIKTSRQIDSSQTDYEASQEASIQSIASHTSHSNQNKYRLGQFDIQEESDVQEEDQQQHVQVQDSYPQRLNEQSSHSIQLVLSSSQNQQHQLDISLKSRSIRSDVISEISAIEIQDQVIPEQREIDLEAVESLISGFYVCKYGRQNRFNPDKRFIQLSPDLKLLVIRDCEFKIKKVFAINHISKIESGLKTENFKRFKIPFEAQSRCFSVYLPERTLDFQAMTFEEMHQIMNSISSLI